MANNPPADSWAFILGDHGSDVKVITMVQSPALPPVEVSLDKTLIATYVMAVEKRTLHIAGRAHMYNMKLRWCE